MERFDAKTILEKYYEGLTSKQEDKSLHDFLSSYEGADEELLEAKELFAFFREESEETLALDFTTITGEQPNRKVRKLYLWGTSVAAAAVLILSFILVFNYPQNKVVYAFVDGKPITNKQEALAYSKQAMTQLSNNLNKGTENLNYMGTLNMPEALLTVKK